MDNLKYLSDGSHVELVTQLENGRYLVRPMVYIDDYEAVPSEQIIEVGTVHDKPPVNKYDSDIKLAKERLALINQEVKELQNTLATTKTEHKELIKRAELDDAIKYIFDFIDGKITHFLTFEYGNYKITTFKEEMLEAAYSSSRAARLLTLSYTPKSATWLINSYSDGSGSNKGILPFCSYEDALAELKKRILEKAHSLIGKYEHHTANAVIRAAQEYDIPLPDELVQHHKDVITADREKQAAVLRSQLAKLEEAADV